MLSKVQISLLLFPCYLFLGFRIEEHYHNFPLFPRTVQHLTFSLWLLSAALSRAPELQMSKSESVLGWNGFMFGGINSCLVKSTHVWFVLQKRRKHSNFQRHSVSGWPLQSSIPFQEFLYGCHVPFWNDLNSVRALYFSSECWYH